MSIHAWLPALVEFSAYRDWLAYEDAIYNRFCADFLNPQSPVMYRGLRVMIKRHPQIDGREATFWHCISEGSSGESKRNPDLRRCARICWLRPCIENSQHMMVWTERRNFDYRDHLWLQDEGYLVVLAYRSGLSGQPPYYLLWTAFYVHRAHERKKYVARFLSAQKSQK